MKSIKIVIASLLVCILIAACSNQTNGNAAQKVDEPKKAQKPFTSMKELRKLDWDHPEKIDWDQIYISKKDFETIIKNDNSR
jgi:hypothetical protein